MRIQLKDLFSRRRIVVHHTHLLENNWDEKLLEDEDLVFFDDCLFSQYVFLKNCQKTIARKHIECILGFSSGLYADESSSSQIYDIKSSVIHDCCNQRIKTLEDANQLRSSIPEMNGFMKVSQLKELLDLPFCHLALHGCCHLKLEKEKNLLKKIKTFNQDLQSGIENLTRLGLSVPQIWVYPYVHSFPTSDIALKKSGFSQIVGSQSLFRISVENLPHQILNCDS